MDTMKITAHTPSAPDFFVNVNVLVVDEKVIVHVSADSPIDYGYGVRTYFTAEVDFSPLDAFFSVYKVARSVKRVDGGDPTELSRELAVQVARTATDEWVKTREGKDFVRNHKIALAQALMAEAQELV